MESPRYGRMPGVIGCGRAVIALSLALLAPCGSGLAADDAPEPAAKKSAQRSRPLTASRSDFEQLNKASQELLQIQEEIRAAEARAVERRKAAADRLRDLEAEKGPLERTVEALKARGAAREKDLTARNETLAARQKEVEKLKAQASALVEPMEGFLRQGLRLAESGIPWKIEERKASFGRAIAALPSVPPGITLSAIGRLQAEEESLARLIESGTVEVPLPGESVAAPAFPLGLLAVSFASADGSTVGFARPGQKLEEGLLKDRSDPRLLQGYRAALDILRRQSTPRIVDLQVPALPRETEDSKEAK